MISIRVPTKHEFFSASSAAVLRELRGYKLSIVIIEAAKGRTEI
jgi:hypothetical protein